MSDKYEFIAREDWEDVALVERVMGMMSLDEEFRRKMEKDPKKTLEEYNIPIEVKDVEFEPLECTIPLKMKAHVPGTRAEKYADFMNKKHEYVEVIKKECIPTNPAMAKWRERQVGRSMMEIGAKITRVIHATFTLELADGCSIGCEFCGLNAGKLKSVFRYTDENAELFKGVIYKAKEIIGDSAGEGTMYFATEPLDNPDYELFLADYLECFDKLPQITTAAAIRHKDRLHKLLKQLNERNDRIYRFSVTSYEMYKQIMEEFSAEELALVELLPQFEEAPNNSFVNAGREGDKNDEYGDTISCISGFVVNMCRKEIRLTTPTCASAEHPTGEIILETAHFETVDDFENIIKGMISKYMKNIIGPKVGFKLRDGLCYDIKDDSVIISCKDEIQYKLDTREATSMYKLMLDEFAKGYVTRRDIVSKLNQLEECKGGRKDVLFYAINKLWTMGVLVAENGEI